MTLRPVALAAALAVAPACVESAEAPAADAAATAPDATPGAPDAPAPEPPDAAPLVCVTPPPTEGDSLTAFRVPLLAIAVDGAIDEEAWRYANRVQLANEARSDNAVTVYALWSERSLFLAYEVSDLQLEAVGGEPHLDDGAELYLDTEHDATPTMDADDHHFIATIAGVYLGEPIVARTVTGAGGYTMEIGVPWEGVGLSPTGAATYGLLLGNNDRDNDVSAQFDWLDLIESGQYDRPNLWGDLVLSPQACSD